MRFLDRILNSPQHTQHESNIHRIVADNVSDYYWQTTDQEMWEIDDFHNIAPPFPHFIIEWRSPSRTISKKDGIQPWPAWMPTAFAAEFLTIDLPKLREMTPEYRMHQQLEELASKHPEARWCVCCKLFSSGGDISNGPDHEDGTVFMFVNGDGKPIKISGDNYFMGRPARTDTNFYRAVESMAVHDIMQDSHLASTEFTKIEKIVSSTLETHEPTIDVALLTISFMHCKNVELEERTIDKKLAKRTFERHGIHLFSYHVLNIDPMKSVLSRANRDAGEGMKGKALHICRGHFKDYRQRGLFGKQKGVFWWADKLVGSSEFGKIDKLYNVKAKTK